MSVSKKSISKESIKHYLIELGRWVVAHKLKSGCIVGCVIALVHFLFIDNHSVMQWIRNKSLIISLESEIEHYQERKQQDLQKLHALDSTSTAIYQFARERYYMKSKSEDVFIFKAADSLKKNVEE